MDKRVKKKVVVGIIIVIIMLVMSGVKLYKYNQAYDALSDDISAFAYKIEENMMSQSVTKESLMDDYEKMQVKINELYLITPKFKFMDVAMMEFDLNCLQKVIIYYDKIPSYSESQMFEFNLIIENAKDKDI